MFCPQCGQQQASDATRFCSRCGFQLAAVSGLLTTNGVSPEMTFEAAPAPPSPRRKGAQFGGKLMLSGAFLIPALAILSELLNVPEELPLLGVLVFMAGFFRLIYALIFEDGPFRRQMQRQPAFIPSQQPQQFGQPREASALPPAQQQFPAHGYAPPRADTADLGYRPSVTEGTTRLLDKERDESAR